MNNCNHYWRLAVASYGVELGVEVCECIECGGVKEVLIWS